MQVTPEQERLERQRPELFDAAAEQIFFRQIVGENETRDLRPDTVDLPSDPPLPSEQRDSLDVARHLSLPVKNGPLMMARPAADGQ